MRPGSIIIFPHIDLQADFSIRLADLEPVVVLQGKRGKEGIFNAGTKLYARGGSGPGAGYLQVPRLQGDPQAQC